MMNITEKNSEIKDSSMNLKRAPSAGTVTSTTDNLMWERSQSDVNLNLHKERKSDSPKVSDNSRVYWDLSRVDRTDGSKNESAIGSVISSGIVNSTGIGGFQISLETIHQRDEMFEIDSSNESLTSSSFVETNLSYQKLENQFHNRPNSHTLNSGISSMEQLPNYSHNKRHLSEVEIRKSCSELSSSFKLKSTGVNSVNEVPETDQTKYTNSNCLVFENQIGFPKDSLMRKPPLPFETQSSNYFCESDFDDSREQIPNYQVKLKLLQDEFCDLIQQLDLQKYTEFEWPSENAINNKIQILSRCNQMLRQAWMMPNIGRDYATSLCDIIRQEGLLNYLTHCMTHAGQVANAFDRGTEPDPNYMATKRLFILSAAELYGQILTCENLDSILGLSSGSSTPKMESSNDFLNLENLSRPAKIFKEVVRQSWLVRTDIAMNREFIAILEAMLKHHEKTNRLVVQSGGLKSLIFSCRSTDNLTLRHVAFAMVNLGLFGDFDIQVTMAQHKVADWLFPLAFHSDDIIKYYACLAIVVLSAHKELAQIVYSSGTIELVFSFIKSHSPYHFAEIEPSHLQGRSAKWLQRLLPLLRSDSIETVSLSSFHFVMEARIKQKQGKTQIFNEIGAIEVLQKVASTTYRLAAQFARQALKILGEPIPYSIFHPVPIWNVEDVCHWLNQIDFVDLSKSFETLKIDGDILLTLNEEMMKEDLGIKNGIVRLRLLREISKLKSLTSYETCDPTSVHEWLKLCVGSNYSQYTYSLIKAGVDRKFLPNISDEMLANDCSINNSVHRTRILNAIETCKAQFNKDSKSTEQLVTKSPDLTYKRQLSVPKQDSLDKVNGLLCEQCVISNHADDTLINEERINKNIDVFISYRRNNGSQLASLLMVHLRLRGYRVFLDIERLPGGKFNENLLQSIQRARNFIIVLTPNSLDRCIGDIEKKDWIHRRIEDVYCKRLECTFPNIPFTISELEAYLRKMEIVCALQSDCNVIPVTDRFEFPLEENLPSDMRSILHYNAVSWVHDYQDACVEKIEQFMKSFDCKCPFSPPQTRMSPVIKPLSYLTNFQEDMLNF